MARPNSGDEGFTLIEMVIAIMIMGVAVLTLVSALSTMLLLSGQHRGQAVIETSAHSFSQAVMATGQFSTTLTSGVTAAATSLPVKDATLLSIGNYVSVDLETMRVTSVGSGSVGVTRAVNSGSTATAHSSGASVNRLLKCPSAADLTPPSGTYATTPGVNVPTITAVEYWNPATSSFASTSASSCATSYNQVCAGDILAECGTGLYRATISVTTTGDSRLRSLTDTTSVLVRSGDA